MKYRNYRHLASLKNVSFKGFGRWIFVFISLSFIDQNIGSTLTLGSFVLAFLIGQCYSTFDSFANLPSINSMYPITSKQRVKYSYFLVLESICYLLFIFVGFAVGFLVVKYGVENGLSNLTNGFADLVTDKGVIFKLFYSITYFSSILPLSYIKRKRDWYIAFGSGTIFFAGINLILINLADHSDWPGFIMKNDVISKFETLPNHNVILTIAVIMSVVSVSMSIVVSNQLTKRKRFHSTV